MFGFRPEGRAVRDMDPIVRMTSYIMPQRSDAQVFLHQDLDYEALARYIADMSNRGHKITFMHVIIAAYVRAISQYPEINRFVVNKKLYSRKELTTSFTMLRDTPDGSIEETAVKVYFDPHDTIFDVKDRVDAMVAENRPAEDSTFIIKFVNFLFSIPLLPTVVIGLARFLDRYGILPRFIVDVSPFHTSMFITNMASIGMHSVNHHIYNFGTTSLFLSMGMVERKLTLTNDGRVVRKRVLPVGITADERVCAGAMYANLFSTMLRYIKTPQLLEEPPESVRFDPKCEFSVPKPGASEGENAHN